jgi:MFS family permease
MAAPTPRRSFTERFLINRNYARLWYGQAVSTLGDYAFDTTLVLWIGAILAKDSSGHIASWAPGAVSGLMICIFGAVLLVGPFAGVFVDRWSRRRTMLMSELIRALVVGVLTTLSLLPKDSMPIWTWLAILYACVFIVNAVGQFFDPARFATIGDIVTGDADRARAAGIGQATRATAAIVGPPLAAPLLVTSGLQWALLLNALSFIGSYFCIRSVQMPAADLAPKPPSGERPKLRTEFVAGLRMFAGNRFLVAILTIAVICQLGTGAINALDVFFITGNLHANAHLFGLASMAFGIGSIVGALSAGMVVKRLSARTTTWLMLLLTGVFFVWYSRQTAFVWGLILVVAFAIPVTMLNTSISPMLLSAAPREYMGRMIAVFNPVNQGASVVSVAIAGWLASTVLQGFHGSVAGVHVGRIDIIFSVAGLLILLSGAYAFFALPRPSSDDVGGSARDVPAQSLPREPEPQPGLSPPPLEPA